MLRIADAEIDDAIDLAPSPRPVDRAPPAPMQRSVYAPGRRFDAAAALGSAAMVATLISGLIWIRVAPAAPPKPDLVTMDITPPTPPPPAAPKPQPHIVHQHPVVAPQPVVALEAPSPLVVAPVATPPAPPMISAPPAPSAPPSAAASAPAAPSAPADGGDLSAKMLSAKPPTYPIDSRRLHEQGTVILTVLLSVEGRVSDIQIAQSSGFDRLDHAALAAVKAWRWAPIVRNSAPVMVQGRVRIPFVLR
jgi:protein TonB